MTGADTPAPAPAPAQPAPKSFAWSLHLLSCGIRDHLDSLPATPDTGRARELLELFAAGASLGDLAFDVDQRALALLIDGAEQMIAACNSPDGDETSAEMRRVADLLPPYIRDPEPAVDVDAYFPLTATANRLVDRHRFRGYRTTVDTLAVIIDPASGRYVVVHTPTGRPIGHLGWDSLLHARMFAELLRRGPFRWKATTLRDVCGGAEVHAAWLRDDVARLRILLAAAGESGETLTWREDDAEPALHGMGRSPYLAGWDTNRNVDQGMIVRVDAGGYELTRNGRVFLDLLRAGCTPT